MNWIGIDFETFYSKEYSLHEMSTYSYVFDERFKAYMVSLFGNGDGYVGAPEDVDWSQCHGAMLIAHNVSFDGLVWQRLQRDGIIPKGIIPAGWFCTADMAAFLRAPRNLKGAVKVLLSQDVSKDLRAKAKGKTWRQIKAAGFGDEMLEYCLRDAKVAHDLCIGFKDCWPADEQLLSQLNRESAWRGFPVDVERLEAGIKSLSTQVWEAENALPWVQDEKKPLSPKALREEARKVGIPVPASLALTSEDALNWEEKYGEQYPWVKAVRVYRRVNMMYKKLLNIKAGLRDNTWFPYEIKYLGAHTGRFSGGSDAGAKVNLLNLHKEAKFGVDVRGLYQALPGNRLIVADWSQIEAIMLLWRVGDKEQLELIRGGMDVYEAHARLRMGYKDPRPLKEVDPKLRFRAKGRVLGLGYGCGHKKYHQTSHQWGLDLTLSQAKAEVDAYRLASPKITRFWREHHRALEWSCNHSDEVHEVELASGRSLYYYNPKREMGGRDISAYYTRGANRRKVYGGLLTENEIQATARDVLKDAWIAVSKSEYARNVLLTVYDEMVYHVPEDKVDPASKEITKLMTTSSPWLKDCPCSVDLHVCDHYEKGD